ncbi:hypothetical protein [Atlantibacter subterraneus]|uniref:hypothetical protein n=1 Tax=Atlantibacter subterraneus TaxID=255519 RepID=UPI002963CD50|nr:hypothetical protein [Atlantibacter subterranea]
MIPLIVIVAALFAVVVLNRRGKIGNDFSPLPLFSFFLVSLAIWVYRNINVTCHKGRKCGLCCVKSVNW